MHQVGVIMFTEKLKSLFKKKSFYIRVFITILLFLSYFSFQHYYRFSIKFDSSANPDKTQIFFANDKFSEENSVRLSGKKKKFSVKSPEKINFIRLDIDFPDQQHYDLKKVRINNVSYSGKDLYKMFSGSSFIKPELIGRTCRLHLTPPSGRGLPPLDYYILFKVKRSDSAMDFYGLHFILLPCVLIILAILTWLPIKSKKQVNFSPSLPALPSCPPFIEKILSRLNNYDKRNIKYIFLKWIIYGLILFVFNTSFNYHKYDFSIKLSPLSDARLIQVYYRGNNSFSDKNYAYFQYHDILEIEKAPKSCGELKFSSFKKNPVYSFRLDIDKAISPDFRLEYVKINNVTYSGKELFNMLAGLHNMKAAADGDSCILTLIPGADGKFHSDNNATFNFSSPLKYLDFLEILSLVKLFAFIILTAFICYLPAEKIRKAFENIPQFMPAAAIISLFGLTVSFLSLRPFIYLKKIEEAGFFLLRGDISVLFFILGCIALRFIFRKKSIAWLLYLILWGVLLCIFADCFIHNQFSVRTCIVESASWTRNLKWTIPIIWRVFCTDFAFIQFLIIAFMTLLWVSDSFMNKKQRIRLLICCAVIAAGGVVIKLLPAKHNIFETEYSNVFVYSLNQQMYKTYSKEYLAKFEPFKPLYREEKGLNLNRNTILLVVESLSSYQSKFFSGLFDNMPNFDREIGAASTLTKKYLASSYNTTTNTFTLLTGFSPLHLAGKTGLWGFASDKYYQHPLPQIFRENGYRTVFMKPAKQVDFVDLLLKKTCFDEVSDDLDPYYDEVDAPRYIFNSVQDKFMLDRLVNYVQNTKNDKKYFIYAQTVSMHAPYFDPRTQTYSFEETCRTFDQTFPEFMQKLRGTGFFDNGGVLIVTGDHRAMVTIGDKEIKQMGFFTPQYVPLAIFGRIPVKLDDTRHYNHVDLNYSLQYLMLKKTIRHQYQRNIFTADQPDDFYCAFYQQRTNPSLVLFQTHDKHGKIFLNGDKTKVNADGLTDEELQEINSYIIWLRHR